MNEWNSKIFNQACQNIKKYYIKYGHINLENSENYDFSNIQEVYSYIAIEILAGKYTAGGVEGWTKKRSNGPDKRTTMDNYKKMIDFIYGAEKYQILEEQAMSIKQYSDFTKLRVFEVHASLMKYLYYMDDEVIFWDMLEVFEINRAALPEELTHVLDSFITQYLEVYIFGKRLSKKHKAEADISALRKEDLKEGQNPLFKEEFQLRNLYEAICEKYIMPILKETGIINLEKNIIITSISTKNFETAKEISKKTGLSVNEVRKSIRKFRKNSNTGNLCSRPGPSGGYRYDDDTKTEEYSQMKEWINNWRKSMGYSPLQYYIM